MKSEEAALAILAKAPLPGEVKTRLFPDFNPRQAVQLYQAFVLDTLTRLEPIRKIKRYLACYPSSTDPFFKRLGEDYQIELLDQQGRDLGERMGGVVKVLMERCCRQVVLIGTDIPTLPMSYVEMAFEALNRCSVVLGPSQDGGYYLIGLSCYIPEIFKGIPWSTEKVFELTIQKIYSLGYECETLPLWFDVDDIKGLNALRDQLALKPDLAPHTQAFLKSYKS
ncbi:MAG: TIGR04282 family arsenosugar biosynthesis glycosyltransferase [Nitrospira sp.]|nr:TIGR04282 family arsenosugar biosynthesis glycosyltransferase [Nitrospira sp.]